MELIAVLLLGLVLGCLAGALMGVAAGPSVLVFLKNHVPSAVGPLLEKLSRSGGSPSLAGSNALEELRRVAPDVARDLESPPAVSPESLPPEVTPSVAQEIAAAPTPESSVQVAQRYFRDADVAELVALLSRWKPRRRQRGVDLTEAEYEESLASYLDRNGYGQLIDFKPRVYWPPHGENAAARHAVPDMTFKRRVLVELKADMVRSEQADRAMGQMLRYLLAWRKEGAAILTVCGEVPPEIRYLVRHYVEFSRTKMGCAVTVFFRQGEDVSLVQTEFQRE